MAGKMVGITKGSFAFCRYTLAIFLWLAFIFKKPILVLITFFILALSALFKVGRAPLILLAKYTLDKLFRTETQMIDETAMRFAHILGAALTLFCLIFLYLGNVKVGWFLVGIAVIIKTFGALGFCPAYKVFGCLAAGGCCRFTRVKK